MVFFVIQSLKFSHNSLVFPFMNMALGEESEYQDCKTAVIRSFIAEVWQSFNMACLLTDTTYWELKRKLSSPTGWVP